MELERVEEINRRLRDSYGIDTVGGLAMWRVVWSDDQFEHRLGTYDDYTESGIYLRTVTEVRYVPKYGYIRAKYLLERLVVIPIINEKDLPASKVSYEPMYVFEDSNHNPIAPNYNACSFVISAVLAVQGKGNLARYKDPLAGLNSEELIEQKNEELQKLQEDLFGNETDTGDALAHKEGIVVPRNFERIH